MLHGTYSEESSISFDVGDNLLISIFDIDFFVGRDHVSETSILIDGNWGVTWLNEFVGYTGSVIILSETWSTVDDTGTSICGNEVTTENSETGFGVGFEEWEEWFVLGTNQGLSFHRVKDGEFLGL